jgi:hypothetical protein
MIIVPAKPEVIRKISRSFMLIGKNNIPVFGNVKRNLQTQRFFFLDYTTV